MQNKPNLLDTQMNVTFYFTKYCENEQLRIRRKNKAKTNPTCGEQAQRVEPSKCQTACGEQAQRVEPSKCQTACGEQAQRVEPFRPFEIFAEIRSLITFKSLL
jgi:hypothetical protein